MTPCYAYINARIMPMERGDLFEDPLGEALADHGIGEVTGGGTLQDADGEIIHCGVDLDLELTDSNIQFVCQFLTRRGAPKGSKLQFERDGQPVEVSFGNAEGLGIYLNGTDLPDEVYQNSDINIVIEKFDELAGDLCVIRSYWSGPRETALYLYGDSAELLESRLSAFLAEYPLCQKARVERIA